MLEDIEYYERLGVLKNFNTNKYLIEFNGLQKYKISDEEIRSYYAVFSILYNNPTANFIILKAKKNGVKTILLSDGVIDWANLFNNPLNIKYNLQLFHPILHDIFLCVGEDEKKYFESLGNKVATFMPSRIINKKVIIPLPNESKFLVTTANTAYFDEVEREQLVELIENTTKELKKKNVDFIYRIFDQYLIESLKIKENENFISGSFDSLLENISTVITTPSSISINAMYHDRAVGHFLYRDSPIFIQSGWIVSNSYPISKTISSLINRDKERMDFQKYQLEKYLHRNNNSNTLEEVLEYRTKDDEKVQEFININLYNLINSRLNFNFEYIVRKLYLKLKNNKKVNYILRYLRNKIK